MGRDTRASNPGHDDRWTCPACYADVEKKSIGTTTCACGAKLQLLLQSQPVCTAIVIGSGEDGECEECGDTHFSPNLEVFEVTGRVLCDECGMDELAEAGA